MKVEKLTKSQRVSDRWYVQMENGDNFPVGIEQIADFSLYTGRELTEEELAGLKDSAGRTGARQRALRMLGARQMSRKELEDKLTQKGETEENVQDTADFMERIGALNDEEYARTIVRHYTKKGYGLARVKQELHRRGIPRDMWEEALTELNSADDAIDAVIARKLGGNEPDKKELKKLTDMLLRRGFSWGQIKAALSRYDETLEEID